MEEFAVTNQMLFKNISIVGCGALGSAIARGLCRDVSFADGNLSLFDRNPLKSKNLAEELLDGESLDKRAKDLSKDRVFACTDLSSCLEIAECVILAVKPADTLALARDVANCLVGIEPRPVVVSVAAGLRVEALRARLGAGFSVARGMPNLAASIGQSMTGVYVSDPELEVPVQKVFSVLGSVYLANSEDELDAVTGVSASGLAFMALVLQAMADGAVRVGLPRMAATGVVSQTMLGAAQLVSEGNWHPEKLKDAIASPAGTTIEGLSVLEDRSVRGALIEAIEAAVNKAKILGKR